jgi:hypothetical protein
MSSICRTDNCSFFLPGGTHEGEASSAVDFSRVGVFRVKYMQSGVRIRIIPMPQVGKSYNVAKKRCGDSLFDMERKYHMRHSDAVSLLRPTRRLRAIWHGLNGRNGQ